jgi:hypothetical protein
MEEYTSMTDENTLVAPCGLYCGRCVAYLAKEDPVLMDTLISRGFSKDKLPCQGCRTLEGKTHTIGLTKESFPNGPATDACETYVCAVERDVDFCFECREFPCIKLHPSADMADVLPHNMKVFNLCYIERQGMTEFMEKDFGLKSYPGFFDQRYFFGRMVIGKGPQIE